MFKFIFCILFSFCFYTDIFSRGKDDWRFKENEQVVSLLVSFQDVGDSCSCRVFGAKYSLFLSERSAFEFDVVTGFNSAFRNDPEYRQTDITHYKTQYKWFFTRHIYGFLGASITSKKVTDDWWTISSDKEYGYVKITRIGLEPGIGSSWRIFDKYVIAIEWISRQIPIHSYYEHNLKREGNSREVNDFKRYEEHNTILHYTNFARTYIGYVW